MSKLDWRRAKKYKVNNPEDSRNRQSAYAEKLWVRKLAKKLKPRIKKKHKHLEIEVGGICPKCFSVMERCRHTKNWLPRPNSYYFQYWDKCRQCGHLQHYECAKVKVGNLEIWDD